MKRLSYPIILCLFVLSGCRVQYATPTPSTMPRPTATRLFPTPTYTEEPTMMPTDTPVPSQLLRRGVNLGNMLEAPNEGDWGLTVQEEYLDRITEAGFDFIRLPVRWNTHA